MKKWKIRYLNIIPVLFIAFLLCKLIFTTDISLSGVLSTLYSCVAYFIYGLVFAYILNPALCLIERKFLKLSDTAKQKKVKRGLSIAAIYLIVIGFLVIFIINIAPAIVTGFNDFLSDVPAYITKLQKWITDTLHLVSPDVAESIGGNLIKLVRTVYDMFATQPDVSGVSSAVTTAVSVSAKAVVRVVFGAVISVYFLFGKEKLIKHFKRFIYALFSLEHADAMINYGRAINKIFFDFIISKLVQSFIFFLLGLCILVPFDIPFALLISLLLALTNMIPYIGPWIGGIPSVLLALLFNPIKGLIVLLFIIGMQILDNLFIGPKIMSDRVGISPLLVIAGVAIGGTFGGVIGMFIGVPLVAVVKLVFYDSFIERRLQAKNLTELQEED